MNNGSKDNRDISIKQTNMREISILKQRILQYLDNKGISKYECYQKTGITNGVLSQNNGMSEDNALKFLSYYTDISAEWLLTGKGSMLKSNDANKVLDHPPNYGGDTYKDKYISRLESENELLRAENERKQEMIDGFMTGSIVIEKKEAG